MANGPIRDHQERRGARWRGAAAGQGTVLSIFGQLFFPLQTWGGRAEAPLWTSAPLSPSARGAFPVRAKTFLYPTMVPTKWHPAVGAGGIVQEVVDCSALGTGVKKLGKKITFFRARGEQAIVLARRPNIDSESAIWWWGGPPKQRPTAVGERGGGRDAGGSAVEKGVLLFHIRATDDTCSS